MALWEVRTRSATSGALGPGFRGLWFRTGGAMSRMYVYEIGASFRWLLHHCATTGITISGKPPTAKAADALLFSYYWHILIFLRYGNSTKLQCVLRRKLPQAFLNFGPTGVTIRGKFFLIAPRAMPAPRRVVTARFRLHGRRPARASGSGLAGSSRLSIHIRPRPVSALATAKPATL